MGHWWRMYRQTSCPYPLDQFISIYFKNILYLIWIFYINLWIFYQIIIGMYIIYFSTIIKYFLTIIWMKIFSKYGLFFCNFSLKIMLKYFKTLLKYFLIFFRKNNSLHILCIPKGTKNWGVEVTEKVDGWFMTQCYIPCNISPLRTLATPSLTSCLLPPLSVASAHLPWSS